MKLANMVDIDISVALGRMIWKRTTVEDVGLSYNSERDEDGRDVGF